VRDTVDDLLLAADAMRLSGQPAKALPYLDRVARVHSSDSRAALAAFTRGRVLLSQLGRPREAAEAFRRVQTLSPKSSLAEDALAREVESWYRVGEQRLARKRAEEYLAKHPRGRRADSVRRFGGLR
jgi:tetratricopeptide (TPR) repeat protein